MTNKQGGLGDNFYIGGYDLSGDVASIDTLSTPRDVQDVTVIKDYANERIYTQRNVALSFTSFFEVNPVSIVTPAVPASGTPVTSTYNIGIWVTVTGGTGTQVTINGVNQGTFDGTYFLPALGTITLTYTAAPTWNWFQLGYEHSALKGLPTTDVPASYFVGTAVGNPSFCCVTKQTDYDFTRDNSGAITAKVDLTGNGYGGEWGLQLTPGIRTDTAATHGASINNGAATVFGAQAYLHLFGLVGTNVDILVEHSVDNTTFTTLIDFGSQTAAPYATRAVVSNTTTVNQYLRVSTTGTFSWARFAVMVNRNPIAGIVF